MSDEGKIISIPVDVRNPGQFFACCGLLELAGRTRREAEGWFGDGVFCIQNGGGLSELMSMFKRCAGAGGGVKASDEEGVESEADEEAELRPIELAAPLALRLDWWADKAIKPWAGSMDAARIFAGMTGAIDEKNGDPFNDVRVVFDQALPGSKKKPKKREPFYFDARRGGNAKSLDVGFAPDAIEMHSVACPAVEALAMVGLERFRPTPTAVPRVMEYWTWETPLPASVAAAAACGRVSVGGVAGFRFENAFRTDQRKHKGFLSARPITKKNGETR